MLIFILNEFKKASSFDALFQTGSIPKINKLPKGYIQFSFFKIYLLVLFIVSKL